MQKFTDDGLQTQDKALSRSSAACIQADERARRGNVPKATVMFAVGEDPVADV